MLDYAKVLSPALNRFEGTRQKFDNVPKSSNTNPKLDVEIQINPVNKEISTSKVHLSRL